MLLPDWVMGWLPMAACMGLANVLKRGWLLVVGLLLLLSESTTCTRSRMNLPSLYFWDSSAADSCSSRRGWGARQKQMQQSKAKEVGR